jgi:hypothetical protein
MCKKLSRGSILELVSIPSGVSYILFLVVFKGDINGPYLGWLMHASDGTPRH